MSITSRWLIFFTLTISANLLYAQAEFILTGQVKNAHSKEALEFCTVTVLNLEDSLITGTVTDQNGYFSASVFPGVYRVAMSYIGYLSDTSEFKSINKNTFVGVFRMEPTEEMLSEINIEAGSHDVLIDRDVQIVTNQLKTGASTTKDVLDKLDGVDLDRYSNSIKVDNDSKVVILVDGLEKDQEYIKNLDPERLKKIEVIRDPGGRYGLAGYSAVINVILKKNYQGTEIFISDRLMTDPDADDTKYFFAQNNTSATVNYTYNKVNLYAKYSRSQNNFNLPSINTKEYSNGLRIENIIPEGNELNTSVKELYNVFTIGADYYLNPKHTISFESYLSYQPPDKNTVKLDFDNVYSVHGNTIDNYYSMLNTGSETKTSYNSLFYVAKLDENNKINANLTYSNYSNIYSNTYTESTPLSRTERRDDNKNSTAFYIEYDHVFSKKISLQAGYGNSWENTVNHYITGETENDFEYTDLRHKVYGYLSWRTGKKTGIRIGGAGETSSPETNARQSHYLIFQPYADIKYTPSKIIDLRLKYRAGSKYPNVEQTNPFPYTIDQQSIQTGNPLLRPEQTHRISLQLKMLESLITVEPYYHFSDNLITQAGILKTDSIFEYSFDNGGKYQNYGVELNVTIPFGKTVFLQTSYNTYKSSIAYNDRKNDLKDWTLSEQLIYMHEKSGFFAGLQYQKNLYSIITAQGYNKADNDFWITFVQRSFFNKRLSVMLLYFIPVDWGVKYDQGSYISTDHYIETKVNDISFLKNMVMLEVSYRFNKGKTVYKNEKNIKQKEEKSGKSFL